MKHQADKKRSEMEFAIGDKVFIKLQPYVQSSVAKQACHKLSFKYFGPFPIVDRIGRVAYKVALPETSTIHPVFHVSLLRKALRATEQVSPVLPVDTNQFAVPMQVLARRMKTKANRIVDQGLIRWSGGTLPDSWEDMDDLQARFPGATAWGQAVFEEEGGVSTVTTGGPPAQQDAGPGQEGTRRVSTRLRKPNPQVTGDSWTQ